MLVVAGHLGRLHAQVCVSAAVIPCGAKHRQPIAQRVAQLQPLPGLIKVGDLVHLALFAKRPKPGADVFGQDDNGFTADQALLTCVLQVSRQLQVQALQALVVTGEQLRLDTEQVALVRGDALVQCQFDTQVGQVMAGGTLFCP